jgi:hypothetical protein
MGGWEGGLKITLGSSENSLKEGGPERSPSGSWKVKRRKRKGRQNPIMGAAKKAPGGSGRYPKGGRRGFRERL